MRQTFLHLFIEGFRELLSGGRRERGCSGVQSQNITTKTNNLNASEREIVITTNTNSRSLLRYVVLFVSVVIFPPRPTRQTTARLLDCRCPDSTNHYTCSAAGGSHRASRSSCLERRFGRSQWLYRWVFQLQREPPRQPNQRRIQLRRSGSVQPGGGQDHTESRRGPGRRTRGHSLGDQLADSLLELGTKR